MRIALAILFAVGLCAGLVLAHGNEKHVLGKVAKVSESEITVQATTGELQTVKVKPDTKIVKSGASATIQDLKIGDKVAIHAKPVNGSLEATEVRFGPTPAPPAKH
jgi:Cu/Ag efflux protein CusF